MLNFIKKLLGGSNEQQLKKLEKTVQAIEALEDEYRKLTDAQLQNLIKIDSTNYSEVYKVKRVYKPAKLTIRDLCLTITKNVTGKASDKNKAFTFTIANVEGASAGTYQGTITRKIEGTTTSATFVVGGTFWMRDGDTVKIEGLPKDKQITITENNENYKTTWELNGKTVQAGEGTATISLEGDSSLIVTNDLQEVAPTGVSQQQMPFIYMIMIGLALLAVMMVGRRRRAGEDADNE